MDASVLSARGRPGASFNRNWLKILSSIYKKKVQSFRWSIWWTLEDGEKQGRPSILDHQQSREAASWLAAVSSSLWFPVCAGGTGPGRGALLQTWGELQNSKVERRRKKKNKRKKSYWFFVRSRGWSRCRGHERRENLRQPAEPLPVWSEDETTVRASSSKRNQSQHILHTLLSDKLRIWSSGSGRRAPERVQSPSQLHISSNKMQIYCRRSTKRPTKAWRCSTCESLLTRSSGFLSSKTGRRQKKNE